MYQQYFGLSEAPFSIAPDPRYLYLSDKHREALAHLIYGVGDQGGFVLLTGEVGTGKTTICRCLLQQIPDNADIAFIINPKQSINQLLQSIFSDLGIDYDKGATSKDLIDRLNHYLLDAHARGRNTILIIDEAQNLSVDVLEQLRLLTNLETNEKKLLQLVLLGQPELNELLSKPELRQLAQRVTARYHLSPLSKAEITEYIQHRLLVAGCRSELFPAAAIKKIFDLSKGVPRLINLICDRTLLGVYATNTVQATPKIVANAAKEVFPHPANRQWKPIWFAAAAATVIVLVSLIWKHQYSPPAPTHSAVATPSANTAISGQAQIPALPDSKKLDDPLAALYKLWGFSFDPDMGLCDSSELDAAGIYCLRNVKSFDALYSYNVPAALTLESPSGTITNVLLKYISSSDAIFVTSEGDYTVALEELNRWTIIDSTLFTRLHPDLELPIAPGDTNDLIGWLAEFMLLDEAHDISLQSLPVVDLQEDSTQKTSKASLLYSHYLTFVKLRDKTLYDDRLVETIKKLQGELGFEKNAIIDRALVAAVNGKLHNTDPVLVTPTSGEG